MNKNWKALPERPHKNMVSVAIIGDEQLWYGQDQKLYSETIRGESKGQWAEFTPDWWI